MSESLSEIENVFAAFGEKTRLKLLYLMRNGEVSVNHLCESLEISQPKVSRHLAYLRSMDVVKTRRDGKWIFYSLNIPDSYRGSRLFRDMLEWISVSPELADSQVSALRLSPDRSSSFEDPANFLNTYADTDIYERKDELEIYLL